MVQWLAPDSYAVPLAVAARGDIKRQTERANALIVIGLTLACTALAIFDLFLLAAGA